MTEQDEVAETGNETEDDEPIEDAKTEVEGKITEPAKEDVLEETLNDRKFS